MGMQRFNWEQGVAAQAMLEVGDTERAISLARSAIMRQKEGRFAVIGGYDPITDSASVGEAVLFAYDITGDQLFKTAAEAMLEVMRATDHKTQDGTLYHTKEPAKFIMSDAFYMAPPFLAAAGEYDEAVKQIEGFRRFLWSEASRLYSHIWNDEKKEFRREDFWGVGNGWAAAGITRVINHLPDDKQSDRMRLIGYVRELIDGCLVHLRGDGLFHNIVDQPTSFAEVNLSQMIAYSIYRGIDGGWIEDSYAGLANTMRRAAHERVDRFGFVQEVCGVPDFNTLSVAPEGNAFFLLMESAHRDMNG